MNVASILVTINVFVAMALVVAVMWWLSGHDAHLTGEQKAKDYMRRVARCVVSAILIGIFYFGPPSIPLIMIVPPALAVLWCGPIAELLSHKFNRLLGVAGSDESFQPDNSLHNMEMVASLIRNGRHDEALELYETLEESGDANAVVLETLLDRAGIQYEKFKQPKPLLEASRFQMEGKFGEAEQILNHLLEENPANIAAAMMLMRLYVQDLKRSDKAMEILRTLQKQPHIPAAQVEYAQRSIHDWGRKKIEREVVLPES
ncbi:MAG TPA: tetratricopeptide repeat protein, partial [Candidatus Baltobacteraceae bacterium]|nr:tetratricopeptide repeat protein [Candidatus Baltobacteraceae bacterium]